MAGTLHGPLGAALLAAGWRYEERSDRQCGAVASGMSGTGDCNHVAKWRRTDDRRVVLCAQHATRSERDHPTSV